MSLKQLTVVIDADVHRRVKARAADANAPMWQFVQQALERELVRTGPPPTLPPTTISGRREFIGGQVDPVLAAWARRQAFTVEQIPLWSVIDRALRAERVRIEVGPPPAPKPVVIERDGNPMAYVEL